MAKLITETTKVLNVIPHHNADRLEIVQIKGYFCITGIGHCKKGDIVVFITPDDSVLPHKLQTIIFDNSKMNPPKGGRLRTVKIRGSYSEGLILTYNQLKDYYPVTEKDFSKEGINFINKLGITKYQPPEKSASTKSDGVTIGKASKKQINPNFLKYTSLKHFKNYHNIFQPNDLVVIKEKIHGTNFRAGYVPLHSNSFIMQIWKKIYSYIDKRNFKYPGYEFVFGSHNVQLQEKLKNIKATLSMNKRFRKNVYRETCKQYNLRDILQPGEVIYGEVYGANIQTNYDYGLRDSTALVVFDIMQDKKWLDHYDMELRCEALNLQTPPTLAIGNFKDIDLAKLASGPSILCKHQKVIEGVVIRSIKEIISHVGRMVFKYINPVYAANKNNSDWH